MSSRLPHLYSVLNNYAMKKKKSMQKISFHLASVTFSTLQAHKPLVCSFSNRCSIQFYDTPRPSTLGRIEMKKKKKKRG